MSGRIYVDRLMALLDDRGPGHPLAHAYNISITNRATTENEFARMAVRFLSGPLPPKKRKRSKATLAKLAKQKAQRVARKINRHG